mgnify:CR=1 FL=1
MNDLSIGSTISPKASTKFGDDIEGAPISIPTNFFCWLYRLEIQELWESPANIKFDWEDWIDL